MVIIHSHIFHVNFKVSLSGGRFSKIIHQKFTAPTPNLPSEGQNKNVDGWNNCPTSKCRLLTCIYCCDCNGVFFSSPKKNVAWVGGKVVHSSHGANPNLMPNTDPPDLSLVGRRMRNTFNLPLWHFLMLHKKSQGSWIFFFFLLYFHMNSVVWRNRNDRRYIPWRKRGTVISPWFHCKNTPMCKRCQKHILLTWLSHAVIQTHTLTFSHVDTHSHSSCLTW